MEKILNSAAPWMAILQHGGAEPKTHNSLVWHSKSSGFLMLVAILFL